MNAKNAKSKNKVDKKGERRRHGWWRIRTGALMKVFGGPRRYGGGELFEFSDDDAGRDDLRILLDHYAFSNPLAIPRVIKARAPWLADSEREELMEGIGRYWTSSALATAMNLTEAERIELGGVPTIGAVDVTPEQREQLRREKNRIRMREARRAAGAKPREASTSRMKPWEELGISRSTYYRLLKQERRLGAQ